MVKGNVYTDEIKVKKQDKSTIKRRAGLFNLPVVPFDRDCLSVPFYPRVQELLQEVLPRNLVGSLETNPENKQE